VLALCSYPRMAFNPVDAGLRNRSLVRTRLFRGLVQLLMRLVVYNLDRKEVEKYVV